MPPEIAIARRRHSRFAFAAEPVTRDPALAFNRGRYLRVMPPGTKSSRNSPLPEFPRIPRGRHGIPRELVLRNQRDRLLAGVAKAVGERGFANVTIADIVRHARVSRRTFYDHFAGKEECVEAAFGPPFASLVNHEGRRRFGSPTTPSHDFGADGSTSTSSPDSPVPLPPGRHGLPREVVQNNQRARLLAGAAKAVEEGGFANVTIADIVRHAKVSRRTFYDHFAGKEECFEAAFARLADDADGQGGIVVPCSTNGSSTNGCGDPSELARAQKELVDRYRRERLIAGAFKAVEERGLANVTIADILRHGRASRQIFYELFAGKDECLAAAYRERAMRLSKVDSPANPPENR
jgi:AcrR family transcriptional regulator